MKRIYQGAEQGVIWLGEPAECGEVGCDLIKHLCDLKDRSVSFKETGFSDREIEIYNHGLPATREPAWIALSTILRKPWFKRVWKIQEAAFPNSLKVFCGSEELDWEEMYRAILCAFESGLVGSPNPLNLGAARFSNMATMRDTVQRWILWSFDSVLILFRQHSSTDKRDQVFAAFELLTDRDKDSLMLVPNYQTPQNEIYSTTMLSIMKYRRQLDFLKLVTPFSSAHDRNVYSDPLPSWVIDWSNVHGNLDMVGYCDTTEGRANFFSAASCSKFTPTINDLPG